MATAGAQVQTGAVRAAWEQARVLRTGAAGRARWEASAGRIADAADAYGPGELARGTVLLIGGALTQLGAGEAGPVGEQFARQFTAVLLRKLQAWVNAGIVDPADLPMVEQTVQVAFTGDDVVAWRDRSGAVPDSERRAMTCALAAVADFVDLVDGPGACERRLLAALPDRPAPGPDTRPGA